MVYAYKLVRRIAESERILRHDRFIFVYDIETRLRLAVMDIHFFHKIGLDENFTHPIRPRVAVRNLSEPFALYKRQLSPTPAYCL